MANVTARRGPKESPEITSFFICQPQGNHQKMFLKRNLRHVEEHSLQTQNQSGSGIGKPSCLANLADFFEHVNKHVDKGDPDQQTSFTWISRPLSKNSRRCQQSGVRGRVKHWLNDRRPRAGMNGSSSPRRAGIHKD